MFLLKMAQLFLLILLPIHAVSTRSFGNPTFPSSIVASNVISSVTTTNKGRGNCMAWDDAWANSEASFDRSLSSERATGGYSTITLSTISHTEIVIFYSSVAYTPEKTTTYMMISSTRTWIETVTSIPGGVFTGVFPECDILESTCDPKSCTIKANSVQLIYWPVSAVSGYSNLTVTSNATEPVTAVVNGTTFTSPTVYLSYDGVSATDGCRQPIGKSYPGAVLSLSPDALKSIDSPHEYATTFNFANLNKPYSPDVLLKMCWPEPIEYCEVGAEDTYNPQLVVPDEIRALDPAWKNCDLDWLGSYDPPRILEPAQVLVPSTSAADVKPTSSIAMPAQTVRSQGAASTTKLDLGIVSPTALTSPIYLPTNDPPADDPSSNHPPADDPSAKKSPANDPSAQTLPENAFSIKTKFTNDISATHSVENSHINDPKVVLPSIMIGSQVYTTDLASHYVIDSQNLAPGGEITVSGTPKSMSPVRLPAEVSPLSLPVIVIKSQSFTTTPITIPNPTLPPLLIASKTYSANSASQYVIGSQTLTPNGNIVVSGTTIFLLPSASALVIGSTTKALKSISALPPLVLGSKAYTADFNSQYIINSQTLSPGGHITMSGTSIFLASQPSALESESNLKPLFSRFDLPSLTIGSNIYTANQASAYIINDQTLTPGAQITVDGTPVSLAPQASALVLGSRTERLVPSFALPTLTIASKKYTANSASAYVINSQTLTPGGQITVDGTPISSALDASAVVIGSSTESLVAASSKIGLGWLIMKGFGNHGSHSGGSDDGDENTAGTAATGVSGGPPGGSTVTSVSVTNVTSVTSTPATNPTQTTAVFAKGARWRWSRTWIGLAVALSTILSTFS